MANSSTTVLEWLKNTGVSKVYVHFDLDVLDPGEIIAADPDGLKMEEVLRIINEREFEISLKKGKLFIIHNIDFSRRFLGQKTIN